MSKSNNILKFLYTLGLIIVIVGIMLAMTTIYEKNKTHPVKGSKEITVEVKIPDEDNQNFVIHTDADYLRQALEEENLIKGEDSTYGFFITEVNGHTANNSKQEWWCITKGGKEVTTGVDEIAISDGDQYELTLTVGY